MLSCNLTTSDSATRGATRNDARGGRLRRRGGRNHNRHLPDGLEQKHLMQTVVVLQQ
jgi:hypothetical protein